MLVYLACKQAKYNQKAKTITWPLQLLRRRIEDDGAAYRRKTEVLIRIKNKIKIRNSLEIGYSDIDNVWRTDD